MNRCARTGAISPEVLLAAADAAYPFGQRSHHPYKMWLAERALLVQALGLAPPPLPAPTQDDYAACEVAIDLVEQRESARALTLMNEQAPRRLNRECPVCGAKVGEKCRDYEDSEIVVEDRRDWLNTVLADGTKVTHRFARKRDKFVDRLVPHLARVQP